MQSTLESVQLLSVHVPILLNTVGSPDWGVLFWALLPTKGFSSDVAGVDAAFLIPEEEWSRNALMSEQPEAMGDWTAEEIRVMGVLLEKESVTPDQYPMTLNSLITGCNQSTSRDPVVDYGQVEVEDELTLLRDRKLVYRVDQAGARVPKFQHRLVEQWQLTRPELAVLSVLMLRGPQTLGQLRQRTERMYQFPDLERVRQTLDGLMQREIDPDSLVRILPMHSGTKEVRYTTTLAPTDVQSEAPNGLVESVKQETEPTPDSLQGLRHRVRELESSLELLRQEFETFRSQF